MDAVDCHGEVSATERERYEPRQILVEPPSPDEPIDAVYNQRNDEQENGHKESKFERLL